MRPTETAQIQADTLLPAQEAAVLFSAGFIDAAIELLRAHTGEGAGKHERKAWLLLLDALQAAGRRGAFEATLAEYRTFFGGEAHPGWGYPPPIDAPGTLAVGGVLSSSCARLPGLVAHVSARKAAAIDMGCVERIDFHFLSTLATLLRDFHAAGRRVILANVSELNATLLETLGAQRHAALIRRTALPGQRLEAANGADESFEVPQRRPAASMQAVLAA